MDWHSSGIENTFEFETLTRGLAHTGWLENVTGGSIVQSYRGDYRVSASLELDGEIPGVNGYVRIWHTARKGGEAVRTCLATLVPEMPGMEYRLGRWTGSLDLYSGMKRLETSVWRADSGIAKNTAIAAKWADFVRNAGSVPYTAPGISTSKKTSAAWVLEFGVPVLSTCHSLADALGGYIEVDEAGRVCLVPYVLPSRRSASWELASGIDSIVLIGVEREAPEICNRVVARYDADGKTYYSQAYLPSSHPWSRDRIGRQESYSMEVDEVAAPIQANLDKIAADELAARSATGSRYEVRALFDPSIKPGTVGTVSYADSPHDAGLSFRAFCSQREIELDAAMTMTLTLEEL